METNGHINFTLPDESIECRMEHKGLKFVCWVRPLDSPSAVRVMASMGRTIEDLEAYARDLQRYLLASAKTLETIKENQPAEAPKSLEPNTILWCYAVAEQQMERIESVTYERDGVDVPVDFNGKPATDAAVMPLLIRQIPGLAINLTLTATTGGGKLEQERGNLQTAFA